MWFVANRVWFGDDTHTDIEWAFFSVRREGCPPLSGAFAAREVESNKMLGIHPRIIIQTSQEKIAFFSVPLNDLAQSLI